MLISNEYRELNKQLHDSAPAYGISGKNWAELVSELAVKLDTTDILDYGCGKRTLETALGFNIRNYDPCIPEFSASPAPAKIVVCTDVLEHIEPEHLDEILDDLRRVTQKAGIFTVATRPAKKVLADGRNAHLIQKPPEWWMPKLWQRFRITQFSDLGGEFVVIVS